MATSSAPKQGYRKSGLLTREENDRIKAMLGEGCQGLSTSVVQLFSTEPPGHSEWKKKDAGILCLEKDNVKRSYFLRLYCLKRNARVWQQELYRNMDYNVPKPFLHVFEGQNCVFALNFASEKEADQTYQIINRKLERSRQKAAMAAAATAPPATAMAAAAANVGESSAAEATPEVQEEDAEPEANEDGDEAEASDDAETDLPEDAADALESTSPPLGSPSSWKQKKDSLTEVDPTTDAAEPPTEEEESEPEAPPTEAADDAEEEAVEPPIEVEGDAPVEDGDAAVEDGSSAVEYDDVAEEDDDAAVKVGYAAVEDDDADVDDDDAAVKNGDATVEDDDAFIDDDAVVNDGDATVEDDDAFPNDDDAAVKDGDAAVEDEDAFLDDDDAAVKDGDAAVEDDDEAEDEGDAEEEKQPDNGPSRVGVQDTVKFSGGETPVRHQNRNDMTSRLERARVERDLKDGGQGTPPKVTQDAE